jgi:hypothetical protein
MRGCVIINCHTRAAINILALAVILVARSAWGIVLSIVIPIAMLHFDLRADSGLCSREAMPWSLASASDS